MGNALGSIDTEKERRQSLDLRQLADEQESEIKRLKAQLAQRERSLAELEEEQGGLIEKIQELSEENKQLRAELARASKTSRNSSKRPSSDIVKKRRPAVGSGRKIGAQPGHPKQEREPFTAEEIDRHIWHALNRCPDCHGAVSKCQGVLPSVVQQVEMIARPVEITAHTADWYWCAKCQKAHCPMPREVEAGGLCGPVLTAWIGYLKGGCHASFSTIRKFLRDVLHVRVSRGMLAKVIAKVSAALRDPWEELRQLLPLARILNVDETGHHENGRKMYTWCFRAREYMLFKIAENRGTAVLLEMLGADFAGIIGSDYFSSYRCYMEEFGGVLQFCLAHLIREVKFLAEFPDPATRAYGKRFLESLRELFDIIHRRGEMTEMGFQRRLAEQRDEILRVATQRVPASREARNLAQRLQKHGESYFRFITTPGIDPTNNLAEQAIRFVVIDRHVTQGTRSEKGRDWCERIWSILGTCEQQGKSAFTFIRDAIQAYFVGAPAPRVLGASP
jgi:transposase